MLNNFKSFVSKALFRSVVRHGVTFFAGMLCQQGLATHAQINTIYIALTRIITDPEFAAAASAALAIIHSAIEKHKAVNPKTTTISTVAVKAVETVPVVSNEPLKTPHAS